MEGKKFIQNIRNYLNEEIQTADSLPTRLGGRWFDVDGSFSLAKVSVLYNEKEYSWKYLFNLEISKHFCQ